MFAAERSVPRKAGWVSWLVFGLFGLAATAAGAVLPLSVPGKQAPETAAAAPAPAANELDYTPPSMPDLPSPGAMLLRLGLGTVAVLCLCVAVLWAGKRWLQPLALREATGKELRLLEALPLQGRSCVYLIQAGKCRALAGVDGSGLKVLLTLPESFEEALAQDGGVTPETPANQPEA